MSRIGNNPISIPEGVSVNVNNNVITVNGKNGEMSQVFDGVSFDISDNTILVKRNSESKDHKSKHGLYRSLVANMVTGVSEGFTKELLPCTDDIELLCVARQGFGKGCKRCELLDGIDGRPVERSGS